LPGKWSGGETVRRIGVYPLRAAILEWVSVSPEEDLRLMVGTFNTDDEAERWLRKLIEEGQDESSSRKHGRHQTESSSIASKTTPKHGLTNDAHQ
jgi:hypothetical protein